MAHRSEKTVIDFEDRTVLRRMTRSLGCSVRELREAVEAVGPGVENVRLRFRRRPMVRHGRRA